MASKSAEVDPLSKPPTFRFGEYTVGWICALPIELAAVLALLDQNHASLDAQPKYDDNHYHLGTIGKHNVVITCLASSGTTNAAAAAKSMQATFTGLRFGLMVGIGGGIPSLQPDIRLGDVVVSLPTDLHGGVVQYDFGKWETDGFLRKGMLNRPPKLLLGVLPTMQVMASLPRKIFEEVRTVFEENEDYDEEWAYPGSANDNLFKADAVHIHGAATCAACISTAIGTVDRAPRKREWPKIHYGNIASGNAVVKDPKVRDQLGETENVICVEMEAAGLMNDFPCLVIRGISDYADSHKNDKWHRYAAAVAAVYAKNLLEQIPPAAVQKMEPIQLTHWMVPFGRNKDFIGRESHLQKVLNLLDPNDEERCQRVAISGLGGIGKTQIALEVAFRMQEKCSVFWVPAVDAASFESAYREIGRKLQIPGLDDKKADVKSLVKEALGKETVGKWLIIIDNGDDLEMLFNRDGESDESYGSPALMNYLPFNRKGSILFTSRNSKVAVKAAGNNVIKLKEMDKEDSYALFETNLVDKRLIEDTESVWKLLHLLEYLPLAIKQAAAFLNENSLSVIDYVTIYQANDSSLIELLSENFEDYGRYQNVKNPIASTWLISFKQIERLDRLAAEYLYFMSCIAHQDIPHSLLPPASRLEEHKAIGTLKAYAFITQRMEQQLYDMHRLVHLVARNWLRRMGELKLWSTRSLGPVAEVFPSSRYKHEDRNICTLLLPHAESVLDICEFSEDYKATIEVLDTLQLLLDNVGDYYRGIGKYYEAETKYRQSLSLQLSKKVIGGRNFGRKNLGSKMTTIAFILQDQGKYIQAETMLRQALVSVEVELGDKHPDVLRSMNGLVAILGAQGKYIEAETVSEQVMESCKKIFGVEHPDTHNSMNNFFTILSAQGKHTEAETVARQVLKLRNQVHGAEHLLTIDSMYNLALVLGGKGKYEEAKSLFLRELDLRKKVSGADHPDIFLSKWGLAEVLGELGRYPESSGLFEEAIEGLRKSLGDMHPKTVQSRKEYAEMLTERDEKYLLQNSPPVPPIKPSTSHLSSHPRRPPVPPKPSHLQAIEKTPT